MRAIRREFTPYILVGPSLHRRVKIYTVLKEELSQSYALMSQDPVTIPRHSIGYPIVSRTVHSRNRPLIMG